MAAVEVSQREPQVQTRSPLCVNVVLSSYVLVWRSAGFFQAQRTSSPLQVQR